MLVSVTLQQYTMKTQLDNFEAHFNGEGSTYSDSLYQELMDCFNSDGDTILNDANNAGWKAMETYYSTNGTNIDWKGDDDNFGWLLDDPVHGRHEIFREWQGAFIGPLHISEPCNTASNIAYYRAALKVCNYGSGWLGWHVSK